MTLPAFHALPPWAMALSLLAHLAAGITMGLLHVRTLWWNTRRFAQGGRAMATAALMATRFVVLGGVLVLASLEGALPLFAMALGIVVARMVVIRKLQMVAP